MERWQRDISLAYPSQNTSTYDCYCSWANCLRWYWQKRNKTLNPNKKTRQTIY